LRNLFKQPKIKSAVVQLCLEVAPDMLGLIPGWQTVPEALNSPLVAELIATVPTQISLSKLLSLGLEPNLRLPSGDILLHVGTARLHGKAIDMLIARGAGKVAVDSKGKKPVDILRRTLGWSGRSLIGRLPSRCWPSSQLSPVMT
jgi:hypothetical protein